MKNSLKAFLICLCLLSFGCDERDVRSRLENVVDGPSEFVFRQTFEIHDWGEKDSVQLSLRYLGNGKISYRIFSKSGKLHGLNHIYINDSDGFPLLMICDSYCGFNSIAGEKSYAASGILESSKNVWNQANKYGSYVSYRAYSKKKK